MVGMRYRRAVEKLQILAEACESVKDWPPENPFLLEAYAFGDVLRGADPLECVEVVLVLNLPSQDVVWGSSPHGTVWLADRLRLSKGGFCYWWRSHLDPVWNHHVQQPVRFWSHDGPDEDVLRALAERRFADLPRQAPSPTARRDQLADELDGALSHLRDVHAAYWDDGWRRQHRGLGRYPEHELWEAVDGYLELRDAPESRPGATAE
jgi:hypothetical protein